jgi:hypothetical protein
MHIHGINGKGAQMLKFEREDLINADLSRILVESVIGDLFTKNVRN